jgi:hypothetical protein
VSSVGKPNRLFAGSQRHERAAAILASSAVLAPRRLTGRRRWRGAPNPEANTAEERQSSRENQPPASRAKVVSYQHTPPACAFLPHGRAIIQFNRYPDRAARAGGPRAILHPCSKLTCLEARTQRRSGCLLTRPSWRHMQRRWREKQHSSSQRAASSLAASVPRPEREPGNLAVRPAQGGNG